MNLDNENQQILIVDDTIKNVQVLGAILKKEGFQISVAQDGRQALDSVATDAPDLILLDVMMPELDGYETCQCLKNSEKTKDIPVIFLTAKAEHEEIVKGFDYGAVDYVTKPFNAKELIRRVETHLKIRILQKDLHRQNAALAHEIQVTQQLFNEACERIDGPLLGNGDAVSSLHESIKSLAKTNEPVLLAGPPGSGEEAVARAIHRASRRHHPAFIYINCQHYKWGGPENLFSVDSANKPESTTATAYSLFELADGGTLYLEGVNELTKELQLQLTNAMEELKNRRLAGCGPDVRIIAYISWELSANPKISLFSTQLHALLTAQILSIPPLKERLEDIPDLIDYYVREYAKRIGKIVECVSDESMRRVLAYSWPGNIRELQNILEHVVASSSEPVIEISEHFFDEGQRIDRYRLLEKLGHGGMGEVWTAKHQLLTRPVAIKLINTTILSNKNTRDNSNKRFEREAKATARLQSPHTITLFDYGMTETGEFYYVMELLSGMDLDSMINRFGALKPERAVMFLQQACRSLSEAHEAGIFHRDIKPHNLFVCKLGEQYDFLKVLDFGVVKVNKEDENVKITAPGIILGSVITMAPETISDLRCADSRSDIYSLGCVAYKIMTGKHVFTARDSAEMLSHHLQTTAYPPSKATSRKIPPELDQIILQCLEKDPERRPESADALWHMLSNVHFENPWNQSRAQQWWHDFVPTMGIEASDNEDLNLAQSTTEKGLP